MSEQERRGHRRVPRAPRGGEGQAPAEGGAEGEAPLQPLDPRLRIELPGFQGPLDLLLYLIRKHELDILDLPIAFVTERYLEYLEAMRRLDLDVASEYLVMAAELVRIKSAMLLPRPVASDDAAEQEADHQQDPRAELVRKLLEYQKYRDAAERLAALPWEGRDVFVRGGAVPESDEPAASEGVSIVALVGAFEAVLRRMRQRLPLQVRAEQVALEERVRQLALRLRDRGPTPFEALLEEAGSVSELVVTFLALLELARRRLVRLQQASPLATIWVLPRFELQDAASQGSVWA